MKKLVKLTTATLIGLLSLLLFFSLLTAVTASAKNTVAENDPVFQPAPDPSTPPLIPLLASGGADSFGYTYQDEQETPFGPTFNFIDISGAGTNLGLTLDESEIDISGAALAGFDFEFYGVSLTNLRISKNGGMIVNPTSSSQKVSFINECPISDTVFPRTIAPWWDDWDEGDVYLEIQGTAPNRQLIVQWDNVVHRDDSLAESVTFQVILLETTNLILFQYQDTSAGPDISNGNSGTIGILGNSANFLQYETCNSGSPLADGRAIRFQHSSITIAKNALPNDSQDFEFTGTGDISSTFFLDDDSDPTLPDSRTFFIVPGVYTITEILPATDWDLTGLSCSGGASITTSGITATITLAPEENVICTYENTKRGEIVIVKDALPDDPQDFSFSGSGGIGNFNLDDDVDGTLPNSQTFSTLLPGPYTITETTVAGWELSDITCTDPSGGTMTDLGTGVATIDLAPGETVTCTFENSKPGEIVIVKDALPDAAQDFSFSGSSGLGSFDLDDDADGTLPNSQTFSNLTFGTYTITESVTTGWDLTDLSCTDPSGGTTTDLGTGVATIDLAPGETVTCTFENTKRGEIVIVKNALPDDPQDFNFTSSSGVIGSFNLDDDADGTLPNSQTFLDLVAGTYVITESVTTGWDLTDLNCTDPNGGTTTNLNTRTATISLTAGETVTCTFENSKRGMIVITKDAIPDHSQDFRFTGTLGAFTLDNDGAPGNPISDTITFSNLPANSTYVVEEESVSGWDLTNISCVGGDATPDLIAGNVAIELDPDEIIMCTFTNEAEPGSITIVKDAVPDHGQDFEFTGDLGSFTLDDDGGQNNPISNTITFSGLTIFGAYVVTETAVSGWDLTGISCAGGSFTPDLDAGSVAIELDPGEDITCTFENNQRGSITIVKDALPNNDQDFDFDGGLLGNFTLDDDGSQNNPISNTVTFLDLPADTYTVEEDIVSGWDLTGLSCVGGDFTPNLGAGSVSIALDPGENITCTFENTKQSTIRIVKDAVPDSTQSFSFIITDSLGSTPFSLVDNGTPPNSRDFIVSSGSYTITEALVSGWDLTGLACSEDTINNSIEEISTRTAYITLEVGETVTCIFTNTVQPGSITIVKDAEPDSDQDFSFNGSFGNFMLDDDGVLGNPLSNTLTFPNLSPGSYVVNETATSGWSLSGLACDDPTLDTTIGPGAQANIALAPGEDITCTFTNTSASSSITIIKNASPASTQPFTFTGDLGSFTLINDGLSANFRTFFRPPGAYSVSEASVPGWNLTGLNCVDLTGGTTTDLASSTATIGLGDGENVTCTFTNQAVSTGGGNLFLPMIIKGGNGGPPSCTDIDLRVNSISVAAGVVTVEIRNAGACPTDSGFWVDLYANIQGQQPANLVGVTGDRRWNSPFVNAGQGLAWSIPGLNAGSSLTLKSDGSAGPTPQAVVWPPSPNSPITAFVDSFDSNDPDNATFVEIRETNENNNQSTTVTFSGGVASSAGSSEPTPSRSRPDLN